MRRARLLTAVLGVWMAIAPWSDVSVETAARHNELVSGLAIVALSLLALAWSWLRYALVAVGVWLVVSPVLLGYTTKGPLFNELLVGILVIALSTRQRPRRIEGPLAPPV